MFSPDDGSLLTKNKTRPKGSRQAYPIGRVLAGAPTQVEPTVVENATPCQEPSRSTEPSVANRAPKCRVVLPVPSEPLSWHGDAAPRNDTDPWTAMLIMQTLAPILHGPLASDRCKL